jgi:hypothetical protein
MPTIIQEDTFQFLDNTWTVKQVKMIIFCYINTTHTHTHTYIKLYVSENFQII